MTATTETVTINGTAHAVRLSRKAAWSAIESAGVTVWRSDDGKKIRAYDKSGGYCWLDWAYDAHGAYPIVKTVEKVSGSFAARLRAIVEGLAA